MADEAPKVKIRMIRDDRGSENGFEVKRYAAGEEYDVPASLADAFCDQRKSAQRVTAATRVGDAAAAVAGAVKDAAAAVAEAIAPAAQEAAPAPAQAEEQPAAEAQPEGEAPAATGAKRKAKAKE